MTEYRHKEAFAVMHYASRDSAVNHIVWNSRDGVTPFGFTRDGVEVFHVRWSDDRCLPHFRPLKHMLVFVTEHPSLDECRADARRRVEGYPQAAPPEGPERDEFVDKLAKAIMLEHGEEGRPKLITGAEWREMEQPATIQSATIRPDYSRLLGPGRFA